MTSVVFLLFGLCIGSFLNVVALRYDGEHFVFDPKIIGGLPRAESRGRSHCLQCGKTLRWFELIPIVSFAIQRAKCRGCGARIGWQYPTVELLTGLIFVLVPWRLNGTGPMGQGAWINSALWIIAFLILLLVSYIDIRLGIIPDELEIMLGICALGIVLTEAFSPCPLSLVPCPSSFFGAFAPLFGLQQNIWVSHIIGMIFGFAFFELLVLATRGRGMGMGDVKLALPLGFLFGWPDILLAMVTAFVVGAVVGIVSIAVKRKKMGGTLPFGPFLAVGAAFVFFLGLPVAQWYFGMMGL
jgi:prepilin signal peptidase PulO-like enzyme (type II secretory pathway)